MAHRRWSLALVFGAAGLAACTSMTARAGGGDSSRAVPVEIATAAVEDVPLRIRAIGHIEAFTTVSIRPEVTATLLQVHAREGAFVRKGAALFSLDRAPLAAAAHEAAANHQKDLAGERAAEAQLNRDEAQADYDAVAAGRQTRLNRRRVVSTDAAQQSVASDRAMRRSVAADRAAVASARAQIAAGEAAVEMAQLQLDDAEIRAPISGRVGEIEVQQGNLVSADGPELTTIADIDRVYAAFPVRGEALSRVAPNMQQRALPVTVAPQDGRGAAVAGVLASIDNAVDPSTDTILMKALVPNADHHLWPGEFTTVVLDTGTLPRATVVPAAAVNVGQDGPFVFLVKEGTTVVQQPVTTGPQYQGSIVVASGVSPGDVVVTRGQLRLENGSRIVVTAGPAEHGARRRATSSSRPSTRG